MLLRLGTLALAQLLDLTTFLVMVARRGVEAEANPTVVGLFVAAGPSAVAAVKILLVILVAALAVAAWSRGGTGAWRIVGVVPLAYGIAAGLFGGFTNLVTYLG